jgi:hypothetical protein
MEIDGVDPSVIDKDPTSFSDYVAPPPTESDEDSD